MMGLSREAIKFLDGNIALPGTSCWCCDQKIEHNPIPIKESALRRYILRTPGMVADEFLQATIYVPERKEILYYLGLMVKPDGVLAFGDGKHITWSANDWLSMFGTA